MTILHFLCATAVAAFSLVAKWNQHIGEDEEEEKLNRWRGHFRGCRGLISVVRHCGQRSSWSNLRKRNDMGYKKVRYNSCLYLSPRASWQRRCPTFLADIHSGHRALSSPDPASPWIRTFSPASSPQRWWSASPLAPGKLSNRLTRVPHFEAWSWRKYLTYFSFSSDGSSARSTQFM